MQLTLISDLSATNGALYIGANARRVVVAVRSTACKYRDIFLVFPPNYYILFYPSQKFNKEFRSALLDFV